MNNNCCGSFKQINRRKQKISRHQHAAGRFVQQGDCIPMNPSNSVLSLTHGTDEDTQGVEDEAEVCLLIPRLDTIPIVTGLRLDRQMRKKRLTERVILTRRKSNTSVRMRNIYAVFCAPRARSSDKKEEVAKDSKRSRRRHLRLSNWDKLCFQTRRNQESH